MFLCTDLIKVSALPILYKTVTTAILPFLPSWTICSSSANLFSCYIFRLLDIFKCHIYQILLIYYTLTVTELLLFKSIDDISKTFGVMFFFSSKWIGYLLPLTVCSEGECQWSCWSSYWKPLILILPAPASNFSCPTISTK